MQHQRLFNFNRITEGTPSVLEMFQLTVYTGGCQKNLVLMAPNSTTASLYSRHQA